MFRGHHRQVRILFGIADILLIGLAFELAYATRESLDFERVFYLESTVKALLLGFSMLVWVALGYWWELYDHIDTQAQWLGVATPAKTGIDVNAREGDSVKLGAADFQVLETPGHTQGSISVWIPAENKLVAGDTLFLDSIGRTDLPGGNSRQILRSIHDKLLPLDDAAVVIPGHGQNTTIGRERRRNPFLQGI